MNDSDWRDPFEDQAARERAARRAERESRRAAREAETRSTLGERVKQELATERESQPPTSDQPVVPTPQPPPATSEQPDLATPTAEESLAAPPTAEEPAAPPPPPGRRSTSAAIARRRTGALIGAIALIALVAGAGVVISRSGDDGQEVSAGPAQARKTISVVVPEGFDRNQVAEVAKDAKLRGNYLKASQRSNLINLKKLGAEGAESLEGFLFPATYDIFKGSNVSGLVSRQIEAFQQNFAGVDLKFAKSKGLSAYDVVIIASMIEREIALPEERRLAASVIYNRLDANNPLGIDATIRFEDQNFDEPLVESRLNEDTPYNTRTNAGLPPGPIGNPGLASLEAAATPAKTDFFFYVIKPGTCNEHAFLETQEDFDAAAASYQAALQAEGGSPTDC